MPSASTIILPGLIGRIQETYYEKLKIKCSFVCPFCSGVKISLTFYEQLLRQNIFTKKLQTQIVSAEKLHKKLSFEEAAHKILVKLTHDQEQTSECNDKSVSADIPKTT